MIWNSESPTPNARNSQCFMYRQLKRHKNLAGLLYFPDINGISFENSYKGYSLILTSMFKKPQLNTICLNVTYHHIISFMQHWFEFLIFLWRSKEKRVCSLNIKRAMLLPEKIYHLAPSYRITDFYLFFFIAPCMQGTEFTRSLLVCSELKQNTQHI